MNRLIAVLTYVMMFVIASSVAAQDVRPPAAPEFGKPLPKVIELVPVFGMYGGLTFSSLQTVTNPSTAEFVASTDHNAVENGVSLVTSYRLDVLDASNVVKSSRDIGKPTPAATTNLITYTQLASMLTSVPQGTYTARIYAVGPGGDNGSAPSNPFSVAVRKAAAPSSLVVR